MLRSYILLLLVWLVSVDAHLLTPAILSTVIEMKRDELEYVGFPQSALNGTEVEIRMRCEEESDLEFDVQFVLRSSPCDKEFFDSSRQGQVKEMLSFYFEEAYKIPIGYDYDKILYFKSDVEHFTCKDGNSVLMFREKSLRAMEVHNVTSDGKQINSVEPSHNVRLQKREFAGLNGDTLDGGAKITLTSWHPVQKLPVDGIYILVLKFSVINFPPGNKSVHNVTMDVQWRGPYGYLSAIDYPLLRFYALMCMLYTVLAIIWLVMCLKYWKDILRIQFWIGAVIVLGMVEKAMFYSEYATMNSTGTSVDGFIEAAELVSCLKRTMSRVLIIIVSVGYGVVKPRLGSTLNQVVAVGFVYFVFCAIEGLARVSKNHAEAVKQKQLAALPLIILEVVIFWRIFTSLINTMRALRLRRNEVKLTVYRHFTNTLCFAVIASGVFMIWTLYMHNLQHCLVDWKEYWVDTAFWHLLFCVILIVIMVLWRPSRNNQRYAFTPLLDDSEDENDEDELFNSGFYAANILSQRSGSDVKGENKKQKESDQTDQKIKEDLKWIENNIPSSIADKLLADDEEDKEQTELERSKML